MLNYESPLTPAESEFAAEHHDLVLAYLDRARLDCEEFYDIVIFGYLRAVRKYLARPELRQYRFSTIAFRAMSCDVHHAREYWTRQKRRAALRPLIEDIHTDDPRDVVAEAVDNILSFEECVRRLSPIQRRIAALRDRGYTDHEIAHACGISHAGIIREMENARGRILDFPVEAAALAA